MNFFTTQTGPTCRHCNALVIPKRGCVNGCLADGDKVTIVAEPNGDVETVKISRYEGNCWYSARLYGGDYDGFRIAVRSHEEHIRWRRGWHSVDSTEVQALLAIRATGDKLS